LILPGPQPTLLAELTALAEQTAPIVV
jgi:hypothetical protein